MCPSPTAADLVRGACPTAHHPFEEIDGALVRVRVPGGVLTAAQAESVGVAAESLDAGIEITNRANLQLRGVGADEREALVGVLVAAGLVDPDPAADGRRNVLASPTAGIDHGELLDVRPVVEQVTAQLTAGPLDGLGPKFCVVVDGGGVVSVAGRRHDVALVAARCRDGRVGFEVGVGNVLPSRSGGPVAGPAVVVRPEQAASAVRAAAELDAAGGPLAAQVDRHGRAAVLAEIEDRSGAVLDRVPPGDLHRPARAGAPAPIGVWAQAQAGRVALGALPVLGRLDGATLVTLARLAAGHGSGEVRLSPWRSVLVPGLTPGRAAAAAAGAHHLITDGGDPGTRVVACAGSAGCPAGLADTQADGHRLIALLRDRGQADSPSVHLSGCPKRCASRETHDVTLMAGPAPGTYQLQHPGRPPVTDLGPDEAVAAAAGGVHR